MKTFVIINIFIVFLFPLTYGLAEKTRVILIGVDGLLQKCMNQARTTAFQYMMENGSYTYKARTAIEAYSGPGWSNILCGMDSATSGVTGNGWSASWFYKKLNPLSPISGTDKPIPCIFEQLREKKPESKIYSYYSWLWFNNLGDTTIPGSIDKEVYCMMSNMDESIVCDDQALERAKIMIQQDFDFFFFYLGSLDETGHEKKFCSPEYIERMSNINDIILKLFMNLKEAGILDSTNIIFVTDHGATYMTDSHGDQNDDNLNVPWMIMGPNIKKNYEIKSYVRNMDTSPTIMKIFGLESHELWRSSTPISEAFTEDKLKFMSSE